VGRAANGGEWIDGDLAAVAVHILRAEIASDDTAYQAAGIERCVHSAESADTILEHARRGGFPADKVTPVGGTFGPESAGAQ
jgi:hypothetical protein